MMNGAHIHLMVNHLPLAGVVFALPLLLFAWIRKNTEVGRAALIVVALSAALAAPSFFSGEGAEEVLEHAPGFDKHLVHEHEEAAEKAIWAIGAAGAVAVAGLTMRRRIGVLKALPIVTALTVVSGGMLAWTNNQGGEIRHPEIRSETANQQQGADVGRVEPLKSKKPGDQSD